MIAKLVSMMMLLLLPALTEAQQVAKCPQSGPLTEAQLAGLAKGSVPAPRIGQIVASCGIDFEPTEEALGRLRSEGAPESVLATVRAATGPTARKRQVESALWESIKESQDAAVFEDYLRRYPEGQYAALVRLMYRNLKVAGIREEMERTFEAKQWDAADQKIRDLLRVVSADDEIRGWQQRVTDGRSMDAQRTAVALPELSAQELDEIAKRIDAAYARQDYATAAPLCQQLADSGQAWAMNLLGYMYEYGQGLAQDYPHALALFRKAAEKGNALAMDNLGWMYEHGRGVAQDYAGAVAWYRKAGENGEARGMRNLGMMYQYGRGVAQDDAQAVAWFRRAAEKGDPAGMNSLGFEYDTGRGVPQDDAQAVAWYRRAAENGDRLGMNNLGWMYQSGRAVAQDDAQAVVWYRKAAGKGEPLGMNNLGWMYENGRGVVKDIAEAIGWYRKAAALGNEKAKASLKRLGQ